MTLIAVPYRPFLGDPAKNDVLLEGIINFPMFALPASPDEKRVLAAQWLTDPNNLFWEIWRGKAFVGILGITRIIRGLDALAHLAFFDKTLVGKRQLILNLMAWAFRELDLQRLSVEIPQHIAPLIRFARKLGFRYEGELLAAEHPIVRDVLTHAGHVNAAPKWVAQWGSRRERMFFNGATWDDKVCLRILRSEFDAQQLQ